MKFFAWVDKALDRINFVMVIISAGLLLGLTLIVGADITLRYLFYRPLGWVKEVSEYILVFLGFLVAAWILKDDGHVKMDLVVSKVSPRAQTLLNLVTSGISVIVVLIITCFSARVVGSFYKSKLIVPSVLEPRKWILLTPIFVGCLLLTIQFIRRTLTLIGRMKTQGGKKGTE
jgi:C4-dicarboxylate transporter DctQ subunit